MKAPLPPPSDAQAPHRQSEADAATTSAKESRTPAGSINGPLRVVSRSAPEAQRVWAARLLRAIAPAVDALSAIGESQDPNVKPENRSANAVPTWFAGETKPVDAAPVLDGALERVGYAPCGQMTDKKLSLLGYRADWSSSEIEHLLTLKILGQPNQFVSAECSLRHPPAEAFANETMLRYLPDAFRTIYAHMFPWECGLRFDLGKSAGWPEGRLDAPKQTPQELGRTIDAAVRKFAVAKYQSVRDCAALFELAIADETPFRWQSWGDSRRVAMTIYLGRKLGHPSASLKSALASHVGTFKSPPDKSAPSAAEFVDRALTEADAALTRR